MNKISFVLILLFGFAFISCNSNNNTTKSELGNKNKVNVSHSKGFTISYLGDIKAVDILQPYPNAKETFSYKISSKKSLNGSDIILSPVKKIVVSSTTHIPMLELLDAENSLVGFQNTENISSPKTRKRIDQGLVKELGNKGTLNTEILIDINPDLVVGFAMTSNSKVYNSVEKANIPVILNGDWLEETPLGRAEWIKFFGVLFDKEEIADSIFNAIEKNYNNAKLIAKKASLKPTILSGAIMSKDIWNLPAGDSFVAKFLEDANTNYLWNETKNKGSLSLSFESVFEKGKDAEFWIAPGYFSTKKQMIESSSKYKEFKAFKENKIYTFATKKGATGGVIYYELAPTRPDLVLKDIIKITHPELLPDYQLTFFEKMK